jgi:hypothetical protein
LEYIVNANLMYSEATPRYKKTSPSAEALTTMHTATPVLDAFVTASVSFGQGGLDAAVALTSHD